MALFAIGSLSLPGDQDPAARAKLTVFTGTVNVAPGGGQAEPGVTGRPLLEGDVIRTNAGSRAGIRFGDGSVTRLEAGSRVALTRLRKAGGGFQTELGQQAGKTWNTVLQLAGRSSFRVKGPANSAAEVRGTSFLFQVQGTGLPATVRVVVFSGRLSVSGSGRSVLVNAGQATEMVGGGAPKAPAAISAQDAGDPWTLFNNAVDTNQAATGRAPIVAIGAGTIAPGETTSLQPGTTGDGLSDLVFTLDWPGSTFELIIVGPDGKVDSRTSASAHPVTIRVPHAAAGPWGYRVHDVASAQPAEAWAVVVALANAANAGSY